MNYPKKPTQPGTCGRIYVYRQMNDPRRPAGQGRWVAVVECLSLDGQERRKRATGKTVREAVRNLRRQVSKSLYAPLDDVVEVAGAAANGRRETVRECRGL